MRRPHRRHRGLGVTDGGRRGDPTYRSAARHRVAEPRKTEEAVPLSRCDLSSMANLVAK